MQVPQPQPEEPSPDMPLLDQSFELSESKIKQIQNSDKQMNFFTSMLFAQEIILFICQIIFLSRILALVIKQPNLLAFLLTSQALQITALYSVRTIVTWMYSYKVSQVYLIWKHQKRLLFGTLSCLFGIYLFQIFIDYQLIY